MALVLSSSDLAQCYSKFYHLCLKRQKVELANLGSRGEHVTHIPSYRHAVINLYISGFLLQVSRNARRPVMVWLHGGAFVIGSGDRDFAGPHYLIDEDVLFVSLNYRLGAFGENLTCTQETNSMAYGTQRFNAAFARALQ